MLILASSSQTRAQILKDFSIDFIQKNVDFDEEAIKSTSPTEFVYIAATGKMKVAKQSFGLSMPILTADTVVCTKGKILRKAKNRDDAKQLLLMQSGGIVSIITCTVLVKNGFEFIDISSTRYEFSDFGDIELEAYLDSNEWVGKAGAIMVEGFAKEYIKSQTGYESCAMGLSAEKIKIIAI